MVRNHLRLSIIRQVAKFCQPLGPHGEAVDYTDDDIEHYEVSIIPPDFFERTRNTL